LLQKAYAMFPCAETEGLWALACRSWSLAR